MTKYVPCRVCEQPTRKALDHRITKANNPTKHSYCSPECQKFAGNYNSYPLEKMRALWITRQHQNKVYNSFILGTPL